VSPDEAARPPIHSVFIQGKSEGVDVPAVKWADDRVSPNVILIGFRPGRTPRVEISTYFLNGKNADLRREQRIRSAQDGIRIHRPDCSNVGNLPVRVDACVGASGTGY
jgi:hypothetical protein